MGVNKDDPLIARDATYYKAPDALRSRVRAALREEAREQARPQMWRWGGMAAAFAMVAVVSWNVARMQPGIGDDEGIVRDVAAAHVRSLMIEGHLNDVASTDQHTVKPWFEGKLDFAPVVSDFAAAGYTLTGGRLSRRPSRRRAHLPPPLARREPLRVAGHGSGRPGARGARAPRVRAGSLAARGHRVLGGVRHRFRGPARVRTAAVVGRDHRARVVGRVFRGALRRLHARLVGIGIAVGELALAVEPRRKACALAPCVARGSVARGGRNPEDCPGRRGAAPRRGRAPGSGRPSCSSILGYQTR